MTDIELTNIETGTKRMFRFDHAKAHLTNESFSKQKTWVLADDSKYIFENGNLIARGGTQINKGTEVQEGDNAGAGETPSSSTSHRSRNRH